MNKFCFCPQKHAKSGSNVTLLRARDGGKSGLHHIIYQYIYAKKKQFLGIVPPHFFLHERMTALTRKGTPYDYTLVDGWGEYGGAKRYVMVTEILFTLAFSTTICALLLYEVYPVCTRDTMNKKKRRTEIQSQTTTRKKRWDSAQGIYVNANRTIP